MKKVYYWVEVQSNKGNITKMELEVLTRQNDLEKLYEELDKYIDAHHHKILFSMIEHYRTKKTYYIPRSASYRFIKKEVDFEVLNTRIIGFYHYNEQGELVEGFVN